MDAAVAETRRLFARARAATATVTTSNQAVDVLGALGLGGVLGVLGREGDYAAEAQKKQVADQSARAEAWATKERAQVEAGTATLAWWLAAGRLYAKFAADMVGASWNASVFATGAGAVKETAKDAAKPFNPSTWPAWLPWAVGGGVLLVALSVAAPYLRTAGVLK